MSQSMDVQLKFQAQTVSVQAKEDDLVQVLVDCACQKFGVKKDEEELVLLFGKVKMAPAKSLQSFLRLGYNNVVTVTVPLVSQGALLSINIKYGAEVRRKLVSVDVLTSTLIDYIAKLHFLNASSLNLRYGQIYLTGTKPLGKYQMTSDCIVEVNNRELLLEVQHGARKISVHVRNYQRVHHIYQQAATALGVDKRNLNLLFNNRYLLNMYNYIVDSGFKHGDVLTNVDITVNICYNKISMRLKIGCMVTLGDIYDEAARGLDLNTSEMNLFYKDKYWIVTVGSVMYYYLKDNDTIYNKDFIMKMEEINGSRSVDIKIWRRSYVSELLEDIRFRLNLNSHKIVLYYYDEKLDKKDKILQYGIKNEDVIMMDIEEMSSYNFLVNAAGRIYNLMLNGDMRVSELKKLTKEKMNITTDNLVLMYAGETLNDSSNVSDYAIDSGSTIQLFTTMAGGRQSTDLLAEMMNDIVGWLKWRVK